MLLTGCPERLCNPHPWRFSRHYLIKTWVTWVDLIADSVWTTVSWGLLYDSVIIRPFQEGQEKIVTSKTNQAPATNRKSRAVSPGLSLQSSIIRNDFAEVCESWTGGLKQTNKTFFVPYPPVFEHLIIPVRMMHPQRMLRNIDIGLRNCVRHWHS